ncbi:MAG: hypothetical protein AAGG55_05400 [Pseudomonadota bacterium]
MFRPFRRVLAASIVASGLPSNAVAEDIAVAMRFDTDWFYNGLSESSGEPAFGASLDWQLTDHLFTGVYGHEVLEEDLNVPRGVGAFVGVGFALSEAWYVSGIANQRWFPGSVGEWDYLEWQSTLQWSPTATERITFKLAYADDFYGRDNRSSLLEASYRRDLGERWYALFTAGAIRFSNNDALPDYEYLQFGGGYRISSVTFDLSWRANSEGGNARVGFGRLESPSIVGQLTWRVW